MNIMTAHTTQDLQEILERPLFLSKSTNNIEEKIEHNMWCIMFEGDCVKSLSWLDLESFFQQLIAQKKIELRHKYPQTQAVLYVWFDQQALQLRFNIISGDGNCLPFGGKVRRLPTLKPIINHCVTTIQDIALHGEMIEFVDDALSDEYEKKDDQFVLDVYVAQLHES